MILLLRNSKKIKDFISFVTSLTELMKEARNKNPRATDLMKLNRGWHAHCKRWIRKTIWMYAQPRNHTSTYKLQFASNLSLLLFFVRYQYVFGCFFFFFKLKLTSFSPNLLNERKQNTFQQESKLLVGTFPLFIISLFVWLTLLSNWRCCVRCLQLTLSKTEWIQCRKFH